MQTRLHVINKLKNSLNTNTEFRDAFFDQLHFLYIVALNQTPEHQQVIFNNHIKELKKLCTAHSVMQAGEITKITKDLNNYFDSTLKKNLQLIKIFNAAFVKLRSEQLPKSDLDLPYQVIQQIKSLKLNDDSIKKITLSNYELAENEMWQKVDKKKWASVLTVLLIYYASVKGIEYRLYNSIKPEISVNLIQILSGLFFGYVWLEIKDLIKNDEERMLCQLGFDGTYSQLQNKLFNVKDLLEEVRKMENGKIHNIFCEDIVDTFRENTDKEKERNELVSLKVISNFKLSDESKLEESKEEIKIVESQTNSSSIMRVPYFFFSKKKQNQHDYAEQQFNWRDDNNNQIALGNIVPVEVSGKNIEEGTKYIAYDTTNTPPELVDKFKAIADEANYVPKSSKGNGVTNISGNILALKNERNYVLGIPIASDDKKQLIYFSRYYKYEDMKAALKQTTRLEQTLKTDVNNRLRKRGP